MPQLNCSRITPDQVTWSNAGNGAVSERELFRSPVVRLTETRALAPALIQCAPGERSLLLLTAGSLALADGEVIRPGDLYWSNADGGSLSAGARGATFYCIEPLRDIGAGMPSTSILSTRLSWQAFDDPAGRPTQPVQILMDGSLSALRTRFAPDYIAGEHWHDFDTLYFITHGRMQFGEEGWFEPGDIRAVRGGHSYGPERPGSAGVEFVLISVGGPVALHWSDLEPPPRR